MVRQGHLIAVVGAFLMGCAVLLAVGCAGVRSQAPQKEEQAHTEATASEEARCEGTRTFKPKWSGSLWTTNDIPGCPNGGLLSGTDKADNLDGKDGDDVIHGLGANDSIYGGAGQHDWLTGDQGDDVIYDGGADEMGGDAGDDVLYGGDGAQLIFGGKGEDVLYGGKGDDGLEGRDDPGPPMRDELYCGLGKDEYSADGLDYVDSSCEEKVKGFGTF